MDGSNWIQLVQPHRGCANDVGVTRRRVVAHLNMCARCGCVARNGVETFWGEKISRYETRQIAFCNSLSPSSLHNISARHHPALAIQHGHGRHEVTRLPCLYPPPRTNPSTAHTPSRSPLAQGNLTTSFGIAHLPPTILTFSPIPTPPLSLSPTTRSKEARRTLALQKLAKVFGNKNGGGGGGKNSNKAERKILTRVLRLTEQPEIASLVRDRLSVISGGDSDSSSSSSSDDEEEEEGSKARKDAAAAAAAAGSSAVVGLYKLN
jgi:hypothetical protein